MPLLGARTDHPLNIVMKPPSLPLYLFWLAAAMASVPALADSPLHMRPGLWEITTRSALLSLVDQVPPDQLAGLMALARQHGISVPPINDGAAVAQVCVTADMAQRDIFPDVNQRYAGCSSHDAMREGVHFSLDISCQSASVQGSGHAQGTLSSAENFTGNARFRGTVQGIPVDQQANTSGHWMAASCGGLKAIQ